MFLFINIHGFSQENTAAASTSKPVNNTSANSDSDTDKENEYVSVCPPLLAGLWKGQDRYILFDGGENSDNSASSQESEKALTLVLKEYYGWYYDRAAESPEEKDSFERKANAAQSSAAEEITVKYRNLLDREYENCGAWELSLKYPKLKEEVIIPVAVVDGRLYLDFAIRDNEGEGVNGFYRRCRLADGIKISPPVFSNELDCLYIVDKPENYVETENSGKEEKKGSYDQLPYVPVSNRMLAFYGQSAENLYKSKASQETSSASADTEEKQPVFAYHIRYWKTDMDYDAETYSSFIPKDGKTYSVKKHILTTNTVFTNATGRRKEVRNMKNAVPDVINNYTFVYSEQNRVLFIVFDYPYLVRDDGVLKEIINKANSRRKPSPPPLFPPSNLDFHQDVIDELEKYNPTIQEFKKND